MHIVFAWYNRRIAVMRLTCIIFISLLMLMACTPPPPVEQSRGVLWQRYAHHSIDDVLLAWGAPAAETKLTKGSRLVAYRHATTYDAESSYEHSSGCEVSFLAPPPHYTIENIAMTGNAYECARLAANGPGYTRNAYIPPPPPPGFFGAYYR